MKDKKDEDMFYISRVAFSRKEVKEVISKINIKPMLPKIA